MTDLFALSEKIIDQGITDEPTNRINFELSELLDGLAMVEAFSHSIIFKTGDGLVVFDTSNEQGGKPGRLISDPPEKPLTVFQKRGRTKLKTDRQKRFVL